MLFFFLLNSLLLHSFSIFLFFLFFFFFLILLTSPLSFFFFFFNDTATTEIYTLSLHDALPIWPAVANPDAVHRPPARPGVYPDAHGPADDAGVQPRRPPRPGLVEPGQPARLGRSEEHTSELQSHLNLVCRLLLEKKKK